MHDPVLNSIGQYQAAAPNLRAIAAYAVFPELTLIMSPAASTRLEKDLLGTLDVPADAYYGIQTLRAVQNFRLSGVTLSHYPKLVVALAMVKQAAADANRELGHLSAAKHTAISTACARIIQGEFHDQFVVDMIQGGAGTSTNMNANEVIANIALEAMGFEKGDYKQLHPNNDVNMAQSTNDAYPTAIRLGLLLGHDSLLTALDKLIQSLSKKHLEFSHVLKMGRTQLQDAVPMTLGQEFHITDWFIIHFTENVGMAFGMEFGGEMGKLALSLFRIIAVIAIGWYLFSITKKGADTIVIVAISLVFAGALGNIIDSTFYGIIFNDSYGHVATLFPEEGGYSSLLHGRVVDMLYFPLFEGTFPSWVPVWGDRHFLFFNAIFNVADSAITVGMALVILFQKKFLKED